MRATLSELARRFGGQVVGDGSCEIHGVAPLSRAEPIHIAYVADRKYLSQLKTTRAGAVILKADDSAGYSGNALVVDSPHLHYAQIAAFLHPPDVGTPGVHASAVLDKSATLGRDVIIGACVVVEAGAVLGDNVVIGAGSYVGRHVRIGARTRLVGQVWVGDHSIVGQDCVLHPGAVVGSDGFGYAKNAEAWVRVPQLGRVIIGDNVDIGANTTIDRGALDDTVIGNGVKLDNLIQIAHNVSIGEHTIMAACVGVAGSVVIGRRCAFGGQVGIAGHLEIADEVQVLGTSLVGASIKEAGTYSSAIPAERVENWRRNAVRVRQLADLAQRLRALEEEVKNLRGD